MAYRDLITFEQLSDVAFEGQSLVDPTSTNRSRVNLVIREESERIAQYLSTGVIAQSYTDVLRLDDFERAPAYGDDQARLVHRPVVEVLTTDYTSRRGRFVAGDRDNVVIDYIAGYRRADQDLTDLQAVEPEATALPPVLPEDIRSACARLVLMRLTEAKEGLTGKQQADQQVGSQSQTVTSMDTGYVRRILSEISHHRRLV